MQLVSIISCCRNEIRVIERFLRSLDEQTVRDFELEAIVADGESKDGTREILDRFASQRPWMQVVGNPARIASAGLNAAIQRARGSVVIRMDAHTEYARDYIADCLHVLHETKASMVGGPMRMARGSWWQNALGLAYGSKIFSGGSRVYDITYKGPVDSVLYGCWPVRVIQALRGFDEAMVRNADDDLSFRLTQIGGLIWQSPSIVCWYHPRRTPLALARQFFDYGYWKVYGMRKHRTVVSARHIAPAVALTVFAMMAAAAPVSRRARLALGVGLLAYAAIIAAAAALRIGNRRDLGLYPGVLAAFPVAHAAYGLGAWCGLVCGAKPVPLHRAPSSRGQAA
jgi:glycosyltransferase involved in cell wall biosynthesis